MRFNVQAHEHSVYGRVVLMSLLIPHGDHEDETTPFALNPDYARQLATELFDAAEEADPSAPLTIEPPLTWPPIRGIGELSGLLDEAADYIAKAARAALQGREPKPLRVYRTDSGFWTFSCTEHPEDPHGRGLWHDQPTASTQATAHLLRSH